MTQQVPEKPAENVAPSNGPAIDYDKLSSSLAESLKGILPQQAPPAQTPPVANGNNADLQVAIDALPEKIVNGIREAFAPAEPPKEEPPKEEATPKEPGKSSSFHEWWFGK